MAKTIFGIVALVIVVGGGWYLYKHQPASVTTEQDLGQYAYVCSNNSEFTMTPADDLSTVKIIPGASAAFTETILVAKDSSEGARFEGSDIVFVGAGEEVSLTVGKAKLLCEPKLSPGVAPYNWGDAAEGGGAKQDTARIVSESILGKWRSTEDAKFVREFKQDDKATDWHGYEAKQEYSWKTFTKETADEVPFSLSPNTVYVQMLTNAEESEALYFQVSKITPEELELNYLGRGGVLKFKRI